MVLFKWSEKVQVFNIYTGLVTLALFFHHMFFYNRSKFLLLKMLFFHLLSLNIKLKNIPWVSFVNHFSFTTVSQEANRYFLTQDSISRDNTWSEQVPSLNQLIHSFIYFIFQINGTEWLRRKYWTHLLHTFQRFYNKIKIMKNNKWDKEFAFCCTEALVQFCPLPTTKHSVVTVKGFMDCQSSVMT